MNIMFASDLFHKRQEVFSLLKLTVMHDKMLYANYPLWQAIQHMAENLMINQKYMQRGSAESVLAIDEEDLLEEDTLMKLASLIYALRITAVKRADDEKTNIPIWESLSNAVWILIDLWHVLNRRSSRLLNSFDERILVAKFRAMLESEISDALERSTSSELKRKLTVLFIRLFNPKYQRVLRNKSGIADPFMWNQTGRSILSRGRDTLSRSRSRTKSPVADRGTVRYTWPSQSVFKKYATRKGHPCTYRNREPSVQRSETPDEAEQVRDTLLDALEGIMPNQIRRRIPEQRNQHVNCTKEQEDFNDEMNALLEKWNKKNKGNDDDKAAIDVDDE
jgi:hypothetical protein